MRGETVTVVSFEEGGRDAMNAPVLREVAEEVADVLVCPGATSDVSASNRPDGTSAAYTLHFPKTFSGSLRGCDVVVRGERLRIVGDPRPYTAENCPTRWWMQAEAVRVDG